MRNINKSIIISALLLIMVFAVNTVNAKGNNDKKEKAPVELKNQTHCPVMGGVIDSSSYTDIQGKRVYHCCPMCTKALTKDPDKYFKKAAEDGILFENIQTTCPVSGEELEKKNSYLDHDGRRVYFCCDGCQKEFKADPQKYLKILDEPAKESKMEDMHKGHMH